MLKSLGFSGSMHGVVLVLGVIWGLAPEASITRVGAVVSAPVARDVRVDFGEQSTPFGEESDRVAEGVIDTVTRDLDEDERIVELYKILDRMTQVPKPKENDWPDMVVAVPAGMGFKSEIPPVTRRRKNWGMPAGLLRVAGPGRKGIPRQMASPEAALGAGGLQGYSDVLVVSKVDEGGCPPVSIRATTREAFAGRAGYWESLPLWERKFPGRIILRWYVGPEGIPEDIQVLRSWRLSPGVVQWALAQVRGIRYRTGVSIGCGVNWQMGFGANLRSLNETLADLQVGMLADGVLSVSEFIDVREIVYDDNRVTALEVGLLQALDGGTRKPDIDVLWDEFLHQAMDDYQQRRVRSQPEDPPKPSDGKDPVWHRGS